MSAPVNTLHARDATAGQCAVSGSTRHGRSSRTCSTLHGNSTQDLFQRGPPFIDTVARLVPKGPTFHVTVHRTCFKWTYPSWVQYTGLVPKTPTIYGHNTQDLFQRGPPFMGTVHAQDLFLKDPTYMGTVHRICS